jgi:hypothetical protein
VGEGGASGCGDVGWSGDALEEGVEEDVLLLLLLGSFDFGGEVKNRAWFRATRTCCRCILSIEREISWLYISQSLDGRRCR